MTIIERAITLAAVTLGGLGGAAKICQNSASNVSLGNKTWRAYLSAERDPETFFETKERTISVPL
jgi:hypothetical protein